MLHAHLSWRCGDVHLPRFVDVVRRANGLKSLVPSEADEMALISMETTECASQTSTWSLDSSCLPRIKEYQESQMQPTSCCGAIIISEPFENKLLDRVLEYTRKSTNWPRLKLNG